MKIGDLVQCTYNRPGFFYGIILDIDNSDVLISFMCRQRWWTDWRHINEIAIISEN